ncbi:MAG: flavodoxin [Candidatus Hydrogenedens sp.]|nr:flavodoxin [Candidatus Hydrogenedentota bacterium]NLF58907.1 flavodoxin [Candidatus Hydrogenedens sp.]
MGSVSIIYGSTTGNTEEVAELVARELNGSVQVIKDIAKASAADFSAAEILLLGTSTWDDGQLQQDWEYFFPQLDTIDLTGKKVALFGLGNAQGFSGQFVDALGKLYHKIAERGATICGFWPTDGYTYKSSGAVLNGHFCGLALDQENDRQKTPQRVKAWVAQIRQEMNF